MKRLGLIGGTTWQSTVIYYTRINELISARLGGSHSCECILYSLDFSPIEQNLKQDNRAANAEVFEKAAHALKAAGAEGLVLCANTPHLYADRIASANLPLVHMGEATAEVVANSGLKRVGLLGTRYTMELDHIKGFVERRGVEVIVPGDEERAYVQHTILDKFARGIYEEPTREQYRRIIKDLEKRGAQGVILGCTEIPILLADESLPIPSFDTTEIHVKSVVEFVLS